MFNPIQFLANPQNMIHQALSNPQIANNPIMQNAINMAQRGDSKGLEELARNVGRERGIDVDQLVKQFIKQ